MRLVLGCLVNKYMYKGSEASESYFIAKKVIVDCVQRLCEAPPIVFETAIKGSSDCEMYSAAHGGSS